MTSDQHEIDFEASAPDEGLMEQPSPATPRRSRRVFSFLIRGTRTSSGFVDILLKGTLNFLVIALLSGSVALLWFGSRLVASGAPFVLDALHFPVRKHHCAAARADSGLRLPDSGRFQDVATLRSFLAPFRPVRTKGGLAFVFESGADIAALVPPPPSAPKGSFGELHMHFGKKRRFCEALAQAGLPHSPGMFVVEEGGSVRFPGRGPAFSVSVRPEKGRVTDLELKAR